MNTRRSVATTLLACCTLLTGSAAASGVSADTGDSRARFAAQAREAGFSAREAAGLQGRVDEYLATWGGKQTAANKISKKGADLILALPGQARTRDLSQPRDAADEICYGGQFCAYKENAFHGGPSDMIIMHDCSTYYIPFGPGGSWINHKQEGTRAKMLDRDEDVVYTTPPAYSEDATADWSPIYWVDPC